MTRSQSIFTGHPTVTIEHRPSGPVVVHNRRGTVEQIEHSRRTALTLGSVGIMLILTTIFRLWMREKLDLLDIGLAALAISALATAVGYWILLGRGWEEVTQNGDWLKVSVMPGNWTSSAWIKWMDIDFLQVEADSTSLFGNYRLQIVAVDGIGRIACGGPLSGIATQDEATALAAAIAAQFGLRRVPGVAARPAQTLNADHFLPAKPAPAKNTRSINIGQSETGVMVTYSSGIMEAVAAALGGGVFAIFVLSILHLPAALFLPLGGLAACVATAVGLAHHAFFVADGHLVCCRQLGPLAFGKKQIALPDIERVGTMVAWDSYDKMYHRVAAQVRVGADVILISKLPEADGQALCQALHQHLGLPIQ